MEAVLPAKFGCVIPASKASSQACDGNITILYKTLEAIRKVLVRCSLRCSGCLLWEKQWKGSFSSVSWVSACMALLAAPAEAAWS